MPIALGLPIGYPWVLASASASIFLNAWQITLVSQARRKSGIKVPQLYATKEEEEASVEAKKFNCTQRAHQNTLEYVPSFLLCTLLAGLRFPRLTVASSAVYLVGRVAFTLGYASGVPKNRATGFRLALVSLLSLLGLATATVVNLLYESDFNI